MTYQVLARKWRPKSFASLVGQEHVVRALTHALDGGRLHHAYLFTGTRGVGKTTLSRIFAKALNCETGVTSTPCGVCRACKEIDEGRFVDYVEMDAASNRGVDEMAALLERAVYAPVDARFKVYMIDEVHMLTNHAFNAMLKTLEEPPAHVKFILATTDPQKIPVTVLSRCLQFNLKQMPAGHIVGHLEHVLGEEKIPYEPQALRLLSRAADGSMRDALSLTDQAIAYSANQVTEEAVRGMLGALDQSYLIRLLDTLAAGDGPGVLAIADEMALRSLSFSTALQDLAGLLHKVAWAQFAPASVLDEWPEAGDIRRFADALSAEHVQLFYQIATIGRGELGLAPDEYAGFTMTLLRMLAFEPAGGPSGGGGGARVKSAGAGVSAAGARAPGGVTAASVRAVADATPKVAAAPQPDRVDRPVVSGKGKHGDAGHPAVAEESLAAKGIEGSLANVSGALPVDQVAQDTQSEQGIDMQAPVNTSVPAAAEAEVLANREAAVEISEPESAPAPIAAAAQELAERAVTESNPVENLAKASPIGPTRAPGGASAALDVLRSAGNRVSSDRGVRPAEPVRKPVAQKAAPVVQIPAPRRPAAPPVQNAAASDARSDATARVGANNGSAVPPWEEIPLDDYQPASSDDGYFMASDDGFVPSFESGPDDVRFTDTPASRPETKPAAKADTRPLPPAVPLDAIGVSGDWPALAVDLPLKGIAYQLAFNSELTACDAASITLVVPVPQYAESAQVAKLKSALTDKLGRPLEVNVSVGAARRTAAAVDAAHRAERQQQAEKEITQNPFVQSLIRDFGASIVQGSIKPIAPENRSSAQGGGQNAASAN
ncbi:DNA polymerase III subunit gamma/tau [Burkholderia sp. Leaf177]|uniref:DNA polymerase III subunit gamma/tau n=1 Tax=Burkholderia sp. Leaf177 TaxID=1736287 RepID=UPI0006F69F88|nr:DNA polymerase III subunit gamma/tau [Burkholderia sp. Leaf177]KQR74471.1 DNA polymerase III subunit gamma/tau [Burkholderia sp. Leaf177]